MAETCAVHRLNRTDRPRLESLALLPVLLLCLSAEIPAADVTLKNGLRLRGKFALLKGISVKAVQQSTSTGNPLRVIDTGKTRYYFHRTLIDEIDNGLELDSHDSFVLDQKKTGRSPIPDSVGSFFGKDPFNENGRAAAMLRVNGPRGPVDLNIILGITRLTPRQLTVEGLTHVWKFAIATTSIEPRILDSLLRRATDDTDPHDRLAICRFYIDARMYRQAAAELDSIQQDFPELARRNDKIRLDLRQAQARQILDELELRRQAGQHRLVLKKARAFPVANLETAALNRISAIIEGYQRQQARLDRVDALIGELQFKLPEDQRIGELITASGEIRDEADFKTLNRLDAFLANADDQALDTASKLALAYSSWMMGSVNAVDDLRLALNLYRARQMICEFLRSDDETQRQRLLASITAVEGISPRRLRQLTEFLPLILETPGLEPGVRTRIVASAENAKLPVAYSVLLPIEYSPQQAYPLIVSLHGSGSNPNHQLLWWGGKHDTSDDRMVPGQAMRHGYIVIAPEYTDPDTGKYEYSSRSHRIVIAAIRDARKRFGVDSDRVFLSGHGMGGDAAFDIGMSHPEIFAGVIPIVGRVNRYCRTTARNTPGAAWYVVGGELDHRAHDVNSVLLNRMMNERHDVVYAEYTGRGKESFYEEIHRLFEWMHHRRRRPLAEAREIVARVQRPAENRFYWVEAHGLPAGILSSSTLARDTPPRVRPMTMTFEARAVSGNAGDTIRLKSGARRHTIWLSPEFVDFDRELTVRKTGTGRDKFKGFIVPGIETILEDLRRRGDRQRLFTAKIEIE